jgi:phage tail sheath protein FI
MANFVSPGVYTIEKDVSDYAPSVNPSIVGLVGFASRGPVDTPTLLTSPADLLRQFGTPDLVTGGQGIFGALEILQKTNQVYYVRAATTDAKDSNNVAALATHPHAAVNVGGMNTDYVYRFDCRAYDRDGAPVGDETSVYVYRERPYVSGVEGGSIYPTTPAADWGNDDWHTAFVAGFGQAFDANVGQLSYVPSGYGAASGMIVGKEAGGRITKAADFSVTTYFASGVTYTGNYLSATPIDVNDLTFINADTAMDANKGVPGASGIGEVSGNLCLLQGIGGPEDNFLTTTSGANTNALSSLLVRGDNAPSGATFISSGVQGGYQIASLYPGLGYNYSAVNYTAGLQYRGLQYKITQTNNEGRFELAIDSDGGTEESYTMAMYKPDSTVSATSLFPEDVLTKGLTNSVSDYVKGNFYQFDKDTFTAGVDPRDTAFSATVSGVNPWTVPTAFGSQMSITGAWKGGAATPGYAGGTETTKNWRCVTLQEDTLDSKGGVNGDAGSYNGNMSDTNVTNALIGNTGAKTGLYALDSEDSPITMAAIPGVTNQNVQNALITLAENTQNFLAVVSPPVGFGNAQQAIEWSNGNATSRTAAINSSYAAVYWPWVKQFDNFTGADRWYDPAVYAIGQMCFTDEVADPWFAPAGLTRGRLTAPVDVEVKLNQGDRDALYGPGNIVNPIVKFNTDGIVIYGQRTGQRAATALDRVNVRRLMIFLRRTVLQSTRRFVFEPNDPITWESVREVLQPALADIQQRRGITAFKVVCDASTNTPLRVDRNELWCKIILKPTKTAEVLVFELNLTNQSASV